MDSTKDVVGTRRNKWPNGSAISTENEILNERRTWFMFYQRGSILPTAIKKVVLGGAIVNKQEFGAFGNINRGLDKAASDKMYSGYAIGKAGSCRQDGGL